ncbi:4'-phosphopantetheinyl transferase superfamily protein [Paenibacillus sp. P32E]|uniref:4'-phosphopantetheinyl transferase family protein n=1 Tax=Paenibacillus sp. P32E TaxID=1349434 RepID=UPI0015C18362|nr:4'-phosphopantetheinyl transferase superfamily protein [Paenibacillus sp. P32E]
MAKALYELTAECGRYPWGWSMCYMPGPQYYRAILSHLHPQEVDYLNGLQYEARIRSYLLGRYAAKTAASQLIGEQDLRQLQVKNGIFQQPLLVSGDGHRHPVSISHSGDVSAAVAFPAELQMGIDVEAFDEVNVAAVETQMTEREKVTVRKLPISYEKGLMMLWTAKESLSKAVKTGLTTPFSIYEINQIELRPTYMVSTHTYFTQYVTLSVLGHRYAVSLTIPKLARLPEAFGQECQAFLAKL